MESWVIGYWISTLLVPNDESRRQWESHHLVICTSLTNQQQKRKKGSCASCSILRNWNEIAMPLLRTGIELIERLGDFGKQRNAAIVWSRSIPESYDSCVHIRSPSNKANAPRQVFAKIAWERGNSQVKQKRQKGESSMLVSCQHDLIYLPRLSRSLMKARKRGFWPTGYFLSTSCAQELDVCRTPPDELIKRANRNRELLSYLSIIYWSPHKLEPHVSDKN